MQSAIVKSWRTTAAGILVAAPVLWIAIRNGIATGFTDETIVAICAAVGAMFIGVSARDNGVRSESAGAR